MSKLSQTQQDVLDEMKAGGRLYLQLYGFNLARTNGTTTRVHPATVEALERLKLIARDNPHSQSTYFHLVTP